MKLFPLTTTMTGAVSGGLGAIGGLTTANWLKERYQDVHDDAFLFALIMFLASFFFITLVAAGLNHLNARARKEG